MNKMFLQIFAKTILILTGLLFIFGIVGCDRNVTSVGVIYYDYNDFVIANTKDILGVDLRKKEVEEEIEYEEPFKEEPITEVVNATDESIDDADDLIDEEAEIEYLPVTLDSYNVISDENIDCIIFEEVISEISPGLCGIAESILYNYNEYGIKPSFQLAVFCLESAYGTSDLSVNKNNIGGLHAYPTETLSAYENAYLYDSKSECTTHFGEIIYNNYIDDGLTTVDSISKRYCPPNSYEWTNIVRSIMNRIDSLYNAKITQ